MANIALYTLITQSSCCYLRIFGGMQPRPGQERSQRLGLIQRFIPGRIPLAARHGAVRIGGQLGGHFATQLGAFA